jgi:hypothetical protein
VNSFETDPKPINIYKIIVPIIENTMPEMILLDNVVILEQINEQGLAGGAVTQNDD